MEFIIKNPIIVFFLAINVLAVVFCVADKIKARKRMRRISEKTLFTVSFLGGAVGMYVTMLIIRHKTKHKRFMFGLPAIILLQIVILLFLIKQAPNLFM